MRILSVVLGAVLAIGLVAAAWVLNRPVTYSPGVTAADPSAWFDQSAGLEERIRALEVALAVERVARQTLEEELQAVYDEITAIQTSRGPSGDRGNDGAQVPADVENAASFFADRRASRVSGEDRADGLAAAGFAPDRAAWIVQRESELQVEAMQARFDAARSGEPGNPFDARWNPDAMLREEIGDREYEQYLQAYGRPTTVDVSSVLQSSAGQTAGLRTGDEIVSYGGQRVFNIVDLNQQTMQGEPGQSVVVEIVRDGIPMQLVMPRGPIGISARGRGRIRP